MFIVNVSLDEMKILFAKYLWKIMFKGQCADAEQAQPVHEMIIVFMVMLWVIIKHNEILIHRQ